MIRAGELREKIIFNRSGRTRNASGGFNNVPAEILSTFAKVVEKDSSPIIENGQVHIVQTLEVTIRYRTDVIIRNGDLIQWRGFDMVVSNMRVDPRRTWIMFKIVTDFSTANRTNTEEVVVSGTFDNTFDITFGGTDGIVNGAFGATFDTTFN